MLKISEHCQFYSWPESPYQKLSSGSNNSFIDQLHIKPLNIFFNSDEKKICLEIGIDKEREVATIESSYYVGLDCIKPWMMPVSIHPKMKGLDYIAMLVEGLSEPENFSHLDNLTEIKFDEPWIEVESDEQDMITPFIIVQFLMVVRSIVKKGLKKDYYTVTENLNLKIKGKILVNRQIRENILKSKATHTICQYQEFGFNNEVNRFLKYVLHFIGDLLQTFPSIEKSLIDTFHYVESAFSLVGEEVFSSCEKKEINPFYKEYNVAISIGNKILKLVDHNIARSSSDKKTCPPHWIDMSKLFELLVYKRLRERFPNRGEVKYHQKFNRQEPDFILNTNCGIKAIVDAKYKPRYGNGNPYMDDARQLAGYARLQSVYREFGIDVRDSGHILPLYFIYPIKMSKSDLEEEQEEMILMSDGVSILNENLICRSSNTYVEMYMQEVDLPFCS